MQNPPPPDLACACHAGDSPGRATGGSALHERVRARLALARGERLSEPAKRASCARTRQSRRSEAARVALTTWSRHRGVPCVTHAQAWLGAWRPIWSGLKNPRKPQPRPGDAGSGSHQLGRVAVLCPVAEPHAQDPGLSATCSRNPSSSSQTPVSVMGFPSLNSSGATAATTWVKSQAPCCTMAAHAGPNWR